MVEQNESLIETQTGITEALTGHDIYFAKGIARNVSAAGRSQITDSLVYRIDSGGKMGVTNTGAAVLAAGKDLVAKKSRANVLVAGRDAHLKRGRLLVAVAGHDLHANRCTIGFALKDQGIVGDNNRILLDKPRAILFGAAFGAALGLVSWLLWHRR